MRILLRTVIVGLFEVVATAGLSQTSPSQALKVGSDLRWVNANCYGAKIDFGATDQMMQGAGLTAPFDPDGPFQSYLVQHDKFLDEGAKAAGMQLMCQSFLDRYRSTGLVAPRPKFEMDRMNRIRASEGLPPFVPLQ